MSAINLFRNLKLNTSVKVIYKIIYIALVNKILTYLVITVMVTIFAVVVVMVTLIVMSMCFATPDMNYKHNFKMVHFNNFIYFNLICLWNDILSIYVIRRRSA